MYMLLILDLNELYEILDMPLQDDSSSSIFLQAFLANHGFLNRWEGQEHYILLVDLKGL
jgi:hypothetical protein